MAPPCLLALLDVKVLSARDAFPHAMIQTAPPFSAWFSVKVLVMIWTVDALLAETAPPVPQARMFKVCVTYASAMLANTASCRTWNSPS